MKKYLYQFMVALFAITSFILVACSDDDDDKGKVEASIVGEWELIDYNIDPIEVEGQGYTFPYDLGTVIEFTSNGKYFVDDGEIGSWEIDGNYLHTKADGSLIPARCTILQLNNTTLKIETKITVPIYNEQTDDIEGIAVTVQQTYKKIS